jgi:cyanoexosortase A
MILAYRMQSIDFVVLAALAWGGAFLCIEDQLPELKPQPSVFSLSLGALLLLACLWRSAQVFHPEPVIHLLALSQALGLALLLVPVRQLLRFAAPLIVLAMLVVDLILPEVIPLKALSRLTALVSGGMLNLTGFDVIIAGQQIWLPGGGVNVDNACAGREAITQLICVAVIFVLAFPLRHKGFRFAMLLLAPLLAIAVNAVRIALLAWINASTLADKDYWFKFMHEDDGSLIFGAISVTLFAISYLKLLDRQLAKKEARHD